MPKKKKARRPDHPQNSLRSVFKLTNVKNLALKGRKKHG
jgi:hypothetical protein